MALSKQAKVLSRQQIEVIRTYLRSRRHGVRDQTIFMLSVRAGLRAKEIANLRWSMAMGADGQIGDAIHLPDTASKGKSGRIVPLNRDLRASLSELYLSQAATPQPEDHVVRTERSDRTTAQSVVNMFHRWYGAIGLIGCSSHSGRRTFITNAARKISTVGGSLRDVQQLAGHSSLQTTQRYIEGDNNAKNRVVDLI